MQKNFSKGLALTGTGHRLNRLGGYDKAIQTALRSLAIETLQELAPRGVISGMALGWDQALAEAAIALKLPWVAAIPCAGQGSTCGHVDASNRITQALFLCQACGHTENADINAAKNIRSRGLGILLREGANKRTEAVGRNEHHDDAICRLSLA